MQQHIAFPRGLLSTSTPRDSLPLSFLFFLRHHNIFHHVEEHPHVREGQWIPRLPPYRGVPWHHLTAFDVLAPTQFQLSFLTMPGTRTRCVPRCLWGRYNEHRSVSRQCQIYVDNRYRPRAPRGTGPQTHYYYYYFIYYKIIIQYN